MANTIELISRFCGTNIICHYTKSDILPLILDNGLMFHCLRDMNDMFEHTKQVFFDTEGLPDIEQEDIRCELNRYRQISFCNDQNEKRAFMLWQMWGHYADCGKGVCLVFDKTKFSSLCGSLYAKGKVSYQKEEYGNIILNDTPKLFFENNISEIFYTKNQDWEHEREFRVIGLFDDDDAHYFSYKDSLLCVITLTEQSSEVLEALANHNIPLLLLSNLLGDWQLTHNQSEIIWQSVNLANYKLDV